MYECVNTMQWLSIVQDTFIQYKTVASTQIDLCKCEVFYKWNHIALKYKSCIIHIKLFLGICLDECFALLVRSSLNAMLLRLVVDTAGPEVEDDL